MNVCGRGECQTTAGCQHRGPSGEFCWWPDRGSCAGYPGWYRQVGELSSFSDEQIAAEYHRRCLARLGDQSKAVSLKPLGACG